jgi:hypothetical protein
MVRPIQQRRESHPVDEVLMHVPATEMPPPDFHAKPQDDGQLVVVLPEVLETAGHVLGNLFQRLYHSIEQVRDSGSSFAEDLTATGRQLEECLQLLIDYVAPLPPSLQTVPAVDIVRSLARHLEDSLSRPVNLTGRLDPGIEVMVDVARVSRAFDLLAGRARGAAPGSIAAANLAAAAASGTLSLSVSLQAHSPLARDSLSELRWAVVEKLYEIHGGSICEEPGESGDIKWNILLPLQP